MLKTWPLLLLLAVVHCQMEKDVNLDSKIRNIFGTAPGRTIEGPLGNKAGRSTFVPTVNSNNGGEEDLSCAMEDGTIGQCVSFYLCDKNHTIVDDGVGIIDIRFGEGPCVSPLDICCLPRSVRPPDNPIKPPPQPAREGCGWSNPKGADMRTTGETDGETKFGEFPWMVAILKKESDNGIGPDGQKLQSYLGGGSLIAPNVVLTAAHVASSGPLKIRAGEWDTASTKEIYPYQDRDVASVETHQNFNINARNLFFDVALLFLSKPVIPAPNVGVVCLPPPRQRTPSVTRCIATGWGKDKFGADGKPQVILKKIEVPVVEQTACQTALRSTRLGRFFQLHTSFMCAGGEKGKDACRGDGGSPLSCPISFAEGRYMQSGIVAWGIGCGEDGIPGVYVDVSSMREWIDEKMVSKGLDTKTYTI